MKNFLKKNLAVIIFIGILLVAGVILGVAIYRVSNKEEPTIIIKDNIILSYAGTEKEVTIDKNVVSIGTGAFDGKTSIEKVNFAENSQLTSIGPRAFRNCSGLTSIVLPKTVQTISANAFEGCSSLETVVIPEGVKVIEDSAFNGCKNLKSISFPSSLESFGENVLTNCSLLETVTSKTSILVFENGALYNEDKTVLYKYMPTNTATSYVVPTNVKEIKPYAFQDSLSLTEIYIDKNVEVIGGKILAGCTNLVEVTVPFLGKTAKAEDAVIFSAFFDSVPNSIQTIRVLGGEIIPYKAFYACSKVKNIIIEDGVKEIGELAFQLCSAISIVQIPSTVDVIATGAFTTCNKAGVIYIDQYERDFGTDWNPSGLKVEFNQK